MIGRRRWKCTDCAGGVLNGDGKCGKCNGTGINTQLDSAQPKCPYCNGTGVCATCGGEGYVWDDEADNGELTTLDLK
jgi:DnaJ-class molecular chaperone